VGMAVPGSAGAGIQAPVDELAGLPAATPRAVRETDAARIARLAAMQRTRLRCLMTPLLITIEWRVP
jgi:hypothetical protein